MKAFVLWISVTALLCGQTPEKPVLGTVTAFVADQLQMEVRPDGGSPVKITFDAQTDVRRVAPGQTSLKDAARIAITDLAVGDRVLVNLMPGSTQARRVVVMSANEIAKRKQQDQEDWTARGVMGLVSEVAGRSITLKTRSMMTETTATVRVTDQTKWRRYAPDSVKFADAVPASLKELKAGDQLRARGVKSADGLTVDAAEVVFGTFQTRAGTVTEVDTAAGVVTLKPLGAEGKLLRVKVRPDSQLRRMPDFGGGPPMGMGGGPGGPGGPGGGGRMGGGPPDPSRMIERLPASTLDAVKPGETVVVSSTKGAQDGEVTAIVMLANADFLVRMASMQRGAQGAGAAGAGAPGGPGRGSQGGMGMGMGGMGMGGDFGGMLPSLMQ